MHATERVIPERRSGVERRRHTLGAYWRGALNPRRRGGRRATVRIDAIGDWHSPRARALVRGIRGGPVVDGVLARRFGRQGATAVEARLAPFVRGQLGG